MSLKNSVPSLTSIEDEVSLQHLYAELARIDVMIRREVWRWQLAGQDSSDVFRGLHISDELADALIARPLCENWGQAANSDPETTQIFADSLVQAERQAQALVENAKRQRLTTRLAHLAETFDLSTFDLDVLLICLAPSLDVRYESLYGYLQDNITLKRPSVNLILDLLSEPNPARHQRMSHFSREAPLFKNHILEFIQGPGLQEETLLRRSLVVDETIVTWLLGSYRPHPQLQPHLLVIRPRPYADDELLSGKMEPSLDRAIQEKSILVFYGPDQARQEAVARLLAAKNQRLVFKIDLGSLLNTGISPLSALKLVFRDTRLANAVPFITNWETCLIDNAPPPEVFRALCAYPDLVVVAGKTIWQPKGFLRDRILCWFEFPLPAYPQRLLLWQLFAGQPAHENGTLESLAGQFQLTTAQIRDAVASAKDFASQHGNPLQVTDLFTAARMHSNPHLAGLARKIVPRYTWEDIVLPADQLCLLREIVATVHGRPKVLDEWGVGRKLAPNRGLSALFAGPPGTGKTMAAEVIAAELGLDLYKIDLSTVVSKYIGETEKNLERIFHEAETSNAILFFDEADALFGKRSEVRDSHDRYANIEISYLLQRMEAYDGVTILATNLRANLDEAFTRRLQFAVEFPFPEQSDRLRIWHTLFPSSLPMNSQLDFKWLAERFKIAGGNIRNIIVSAAYLAAADGQVVTMEHLLHGTRRELQKMGRLIDAEDITPG